MNRNLMLIKAEPTREIKWTEEDDDNLRDMLGAIHSVAQQTTEDEEARVNWLKSLKQRMR